MGSVVGVTHERAPGLREGWHATRDLMHGALRRLVIGQALGQGADGLAQIAFAQVVFFDIEEGTSPARIAAVLAATLVASSACGTGFARSAMRHATA